MLDSLAQLCLAGDVQTILLVRQYERFTGGTEGSVAGLAIDIVSVDTCRGYCVWPGPLFEVRYESRWIYQDAVKIWGKRFDSRLLGGTDSRPIEKSVALYPVSHDFEQQSLVIGQWLVPRNVGASELDQNRANVLVFPLYGPVRPAPKVGLERLSVHRLVIYLPGEFLRKHVQIVGDNDLDLLARPRSENAVRYVIQERPARCAREGTPPSGVPHPRAGQWPIPRRGVCSTRARWRIPRESAC